MATKRVSRREFLHLTGVAAGAAILGACAPQQPQVLRETEIVEQTRVVEQTKVVQVEVEKLITATAPPAHVTIQGRALPPDAAPLEKQIFREAGGEPKFFDTARDIYSAGGTNLVNEPLLRNNENIETVPALAESWKPGPNAEYWEFVIRKDAQWSDGTPITADDVVYTYRHLADPALGNPWVWYYFDIKGVAKFASGEGTADDIGVEKVDDRTVRIYGENGSVPFLPALLSYQAAVVVPKHVAENNPEHWADSVEGFVSGGPYIPTRWEHNKVIEYELNPKYNGPHKPGITKVITPILAAGATAFTPWLNKETDLIHVIGPAEVAAARANPKLNPLIHFFNNFQTYYIPFDTFKPPLDKKEVRLALARAIDRETLCFQVLNGTAVPGYSMLPPNFPGYNPDLKSLQEYDVEQAQQLLADAGVNPASITVDLYTNGRDQILEFVKQQWETNLGIKVNLIQLEPGVWGERRAKHEMMAFRGQYEYDFVDPSNMLTGLWRSVNEMGSPRHSWISEEFDRLVTDAGNEADQEKRIRMYQEAEQILVGDGAAAFVGHQVVFQIWWPWVTGIQPDSSGNVVFRWLDISRFQMYIHKDVDEMKRQA